MLAGGRRIEGNSSLKNVLLTGKSRVQVASLREAMQSAKFCQYSYMRLDVVVDFGYRSMEGFLYFLVLKVVRKIPVLKRDKRPNRLQKCS